MERLKRDLKLEVLAKDICSPSHLSRIENGKTNPGKELREELFLRLGINLGNYTNELPSNLQIEIERIYQRCISSINTRDQELATIIVSQLSDILKKRSLNAQTTIDLNLLILRMQLLLKKNDEEFYCLIQAIKNGDLALTPLQNFRVYLISGIASYKQGQLQNCLKDFSQCSKLLSKIALPSFEKSDFLYMKSVALIANNKSIESLTTVKGPLKFFREIVAHYRVIECLLICGTAYKQLNYTDLSLKEFYEAERIAIEYKLTRFLGIIYQNIGSVYSRERDSKRALSYFKQAIDYKESPNELIYTVFSLLKELKVEGDYHGMSHWLRIGQQLLPKLDKQRKELFQIHFNVYHALQSKDDDLIESQLLFAYKYFEENNKVKQSKDYGKMIAKFYDRKGQYKKAVNYYRELVK